MGVDQIMTVKYQSMNSLKPETSGKKVGLLGQSFVPANNIPERQAVCRTGNAG